MSGDAFVVVRGVHRTYRSGDAEIHALGGVDLQAQRGRLLAVTGRSGSGKTTLLNVIGGLERPDAGSVLVDGTEVTTLDERGLMQMRRRTVGFVFQTFGLVPMLSAAENVGVPLRLVDTPSREREERVRLLLALVGLADAADQRPDELSGGQQQRVAIARALAATPALLLADEPTGQLDSTTALSVMALLGAVVRDAGMAAIVATHDPVLIGMADDVVHLSDGRVESGAVGVG